jgi:succinyl-CoA synthetase beta subunit
MLGSTLVTIQTGPEGKKVHRLLVEQGMDIARELYLGITLDRVTGRTTIMASTEGGMDIEEVAAHTPEKILKETIDPASACSLPGAQARLRARPERPRRRTARSSSCSALAAAYDKLDCSLLEINPLVITATGDVLALDAKVTFDDNALYRHRTSRSSAIRTRRTQPSSRPRSGTSATSSSTAASAAWSTAPASRWPPWTSSSTSAASRPTSSTSAAARHAERVTAAFKLITRDPS